ncbi:MAG: bifunctional NADH dehydrogenase FAD-containing subunit/selenide, water dikinase SelD, partial [Rhodospirillaceae bacterium]|nr:bifunctional NADH dehydrogenase FAD-containing subunit/selenide, water dikinase SelD [Rhodospirillaceae bacterium]
MTPTDPITCDIVLVGGGHSHVAVLKRFGMKPEPGVRLTLITRDLLTPYSGMVPGYIADNYSEAEAHIDLRPLAAFANARVIHAAATGLDLERHFVQVGG